MGKYRNQNDTYSQIKKLIFENFPQNIQEKFKDSINNVFKASEDGLEKAVNFIKEKDNCIIANPGSLSLPKENTKNSYLVIENNKITIYSLDEEKIYERDI